MMNDEASFPTMNFSNFSISQNSIFYSTSYTLAEIIVLSLVVSLMSILTITGNTLVIASFATDRKLRTFGNYFILNLALSDLIVGFLIAVYAPYLVTGCWSLGRPGCLIFLLLDYVVPLASAWNMALISLDRYWSVTKPISYRTDLTITRAVVYMCVPWMAGTLWYGPSVLFWTHWAPPEFPTPPACDQCQVDFYYHSLYLLVSSFIEFLLPFVTVSTINVLIYANIKRRSRCLISTRDKKTSLKARKLLSRDKKSARSLAILIFVFLITWGPFEICSFVNPLCGFQIPQTIFSIVFWLLWCNSTINPMLYPFLQHRFRVVFLKILCNLHVCRYGSSGRRIHSTANRSEAHRAGPSEAGGAANERNVMLRSEQSETFGRG